MKTYSGLIMKLEPNQIFAFGSNTQGKHHRGNAGMAVKYFGAVYGRSHGLQGQCYAICTKDLTKDIHPSVSKELIVTQIKELYWYAATLLASTEFLVAYTLATNLSGYTPQEMASMYALAGPIPENIVFNDQFAKLIDTSLWASKTH
jgi:hypothetical protein